ncbi:tRNA pseudouridine(55) synthase TruB [Facklamia miroungae]|uniref:tRNA pseudouridine synthase B n=1 Tax=Facklamia miroungae TaxID=120956 RepID=A0A1G7P4D9_9LACT|nr:tRNA pseudouridine(55) synthase TruB [Facklamia miroungae]NKZ28576.1 tRNA pseudouridine(55) synthase TruB [Facklamia miroungae]SDF81123.1 tRNA pseudouridine55 synthase [Facklamia miroungae]
MNGIVAVWKEKGMTSHDVIFQMRKIFKMKRIGHCGTLDPEVEGVLVVCLGQATKLVEFLMEGKKIYQGEVTLGIATDTEDAHGQVIEEKLLEQAIDDQAIDQVLQSLTGHITQIPPYYSAVKVKGKRLYEYARAGIKVERPKRQVYIEHFKRLGPSRYEADSQTQSFLFEVKCSKGTYVRTLAVDCGKALGYPSHMSKLIRTQAANFEQADSYRLDQLRLLSEDNKLSRAILPIELAISHFTQIQLNEDQYHDIKHGKVLTADYFGDNLDQPTALLYQSHLLAIYGPHPSKVGLIKPIKMFSTEGV